MKCAVCSRGPADGVAVYRVNEKGVAGVWACQTHKLTPIDPVVRDLVHTIERANR